MKSPQARKQEGGHPPLLKKGISSISQALKTLFSTPRRVKLLKLSFVFYSNDQIKKHLNFNVLTKLRININI